MFRKPSFIGTQKSHNANIKNKVQETNKNNNNNINNNNNNNK